MLPAACGQGSDGGRHPSSMGWLWRGIQGLLLPVSLHTYSKEAWKTALVLQESIPLQEWPGCSSLQSQEPAPKRLSLSCRCCVLAVHVSQHSQQDCAAAWGGRWQPQEAEQRANLDSPAPWGDRGHRQKKPLRRGSRLKLIQSSPFWHCVAAHSIMAHPAVVPRWYQGTVAVCQVEMLPGGNFCVTDSAQGCRDCKQLPISPSASLGSVTMSGDSHSLMGRNPAAFDRP